MGILVCLLLAGYACAQEARTFDGRSTIAGFRRPGQWDGSMVRERSGSPWNVNWNTLDDDDDGLWYLADQFDGQLDFGGWMSAGFYANAHGNRTGTGNAPLPLNQVADGPVLNQLWVYAEKPLDMQTRCVDWGLRVDYVFGVDGPDAQAGGDQGWDFGWNSSRDYGSAIPQLYAELGLWSVIFRAGYGIGLQGFEANQSVDNFFYSHNYAFGYGVPGTFSGATVEYKLNECLEVIGGWTTGWDSSWSNYLGASTFMGGLTCQLTRRLGITYHATAGDFGDGTARNGARSNAGQIYAHAIVLTCGFSDRAEYVLEQTYGNNSGVIVADNQWYSATNYLFYEISDCWDLGLRFEWFRDEDGQRIDVNGVGRGSFYEATLGVNWLPRPNLRVRPEVRWDWFDGEGKPFDSRNGGKTGTSSTQFAGGLDVVLTF